MARLSLDAGRLNRQVCLDAPVATPDGAGGRTPGFLEVARFFAAIEALGAEQRDDGGFALSSRSMRVIFRFRSDVTLAHRLRLGERVLVLQGLADPDETRRYLIATCREDAP